MKLDAALRAKQAVEESADAFESTIFQPVFVERQQYHRAMVETRGALLLAAGVAGVPVRHMGELRRTARLRALPEDHPALLAMKVLLHDPEFRPARVVVDPVRQTSEDVLDPDNAQLVALGLAHGDEASTAVLEAWKELEEHAGGAASGMTVRLPWNQQEDRELSGAEGVGVLVAEIRRLRGLLAARAVTPSTSPVSPQLRRRGIPRALAGVAAFAQPRDIMSTL